MPAVRLRNLVSRREVVVVAFAGLLLRCWVLLTPYGGLNADEAVTGLSALQISQGRFGILIPESYYTALTESYLFSPVVQVWGTHVVPLKLMGVALWFAASLVAACIGVRLGGARSGVTAFALLWLVPGAMLVLTTRAYLGYEGGVVVNLLAALSMIRILQDGLTRRRAVLTGTLVGLSFMMHPIYLGALAPAALVVTYVHRRAVKEWYLPAALGFVLGCGPWIWWNAFNGFASFTERDVEDLPYLTRVRGFFSGLLPRDLGLMDPAGSWVPARPLAISLYVVFAIAAIWAVARLWRLGPAGRVVAVPAVVGWLTLGIFQHTSFVADGRYGIMPFPFVVVTLGVALGLPIGRSAPADVESGPARVLPAAVVVLWLLVLVLPYQQQVVGTRLGDPNVANAMLVATLEERNVSLLAGEYSLVLPVSYVTEGRIATAVFPPLPVRYPNLQRQVEEAAPDQVAIVFYAGGVRPDQFKLPVGQYQRVDLPGMELYVPYGAGA